tara:strand:- start:419 stop:595 length:177 start_codon:yes stop_codon:yes gene_type:complete
MDHGIYACLWIIQEQRHLNNDQGPGSEAQRALLDAYRAVDKWLSQQKREALELEKDFE